MAPRLATEDLNLILESTRGLWREVHGQQLFITGGTGFFGCWLVESFAYVNRMEKLDAHATILTRSPEAFALKCPHLASDPAIALLAGDARDFEYPEGEFRYVIHAATESGTRQGIESPTEMLETILHGTERVLKFAASHGTEQLLFTSSGAVYGSQPASISHMSETYAGAPNSLQGGSVYSEGKRAAELMCAVYGERYGIACKIARCFAFVGPHLSLDSHFAIGNFIRDAMNGESIRVLGDGTAKRSYMYAADLAIWLWTILFRAFAMDAFNVGSDRAVTILELANVVRSAIGSEANVIVSQQPTSGATVHRYVPSIRKAEEKLGLKCSVSLEDAIRRTALWHGHSPGIHSGLSRVHCETDSIDS